LKTIHLKVGLSDRDLRLDQYIHKHIGLSISRSRIQSLISSGRVSLPSRTKALKAHYKVKENDLLVVNIPPPLKSQVLPEQIPLEIIFEDQDILIINKPTGMVTHPAVGNYSQTLVNALLYYGCSLSTVNGPSRPGIVHRLDKGTSGVMVVAKNDFSHLRLARKFQKHTIIREYQAIVKGEVAHDQGIIDYPLARDINNRKKIAVSFRKDARAALTKYSVIKRYKTITLLKLFPQTGRTHQLRVHLKHCGHPILGDHQYGQASSFSRLALHAVLLGFEHPRTGKLMEFSSDIPECFKIFLDSLK